MSKKKYVSIIIPVYNEEKYIKEMIESIIKSSIRYSPDHVEILVYDGGSTDNTLFILKEFEKKYKFIKVMKNPYKVQVKALNMGIKISKGDIIIRCDAHAVYPEDYIEKIVDTLEKHPECLNVGGYWKTVKGDDTITAEAIEKSMNSIFGVGISYRTVKNTNGKIKYVDTVPFGSWRRNLFNKIGLFDENFIRAQDMEFNIRTRKVGKICLLTDLEIKYFARPTLKKLSKMMFQYGFAKILLLKKHKLLPNIRQLFPPLFVLCILLSTFIPLFRWILLSYLLLDIVFSIKISYKKPILIPLTCLIFPLMHISYGIGYLYGLIKYPFLKNEPINFSVTR